MGNAFVRLQSWYIAQCDGEWEHEFGVKIDTLDNPGWMMQVDLKRTGEEGRGFEEVEIERSESDWLHCRVASNKFEGFGGPSNLEEMSRPSYPGRPMSDPGRMKCAGERRAGRPDRVDGRVRPE